MADCSVDIILKYRLKLCLTILEEFSWLLDSYILDFFTEQHIEKLPRLWIKQLQRASPEDLGRFMDVSTEGQQFVWPLSLLSLRSLIKQISLSRTPRDPKSTITSHPKMDISPSTLCPKSGATVKGEGHESAKLNDPRLKKVFLKHVKPKKRHEIFKMAEMTADLANQLNVNFVVDVGSGLGHLSRVMGYGCNLSVCGLESQSSLLNQAEKLDVEFEVTASKHLTEDEIEKMKQRRPVHTHKTVVFGLSSDDFVQTVKSAFGTNDNNFQFGIVGLHPCGNLTAVLLNLFVHSDEIRFVNLVGCCYHKLSTGSDLSSKVGFPLSSFTKQRQIDISYEARALACHAIETYSSRLRSKDYDHLKIHCYRAALERIIQKNWPELRRCALNNVKHKQHLSFSQYCQSALRKMNIRVLEDDLQSRETVSNLSKWKDVVIYYSLRLMLAPLIETAILLDRMLFLLENDVNCKLMAAFDPMISPRNHVLIATKFL